jgi:hypothetical protein
MSVEMISPAAAPRRAAAPRSGGIRPVAGVLADGTAYYAPIGERAAEVAAWLGFGSIGDYLAERRAAGWTWQAIATESGQPPSWVPRQAASAHLTTPAPLTSPA